MTEHKNYTWTIKLSTQSKSLDINVFEAVLSGNNSIATVRDLLVDRKAIPRLNALTKIERSVERLVRAKALRWGPNKTLEVVE